MRKLLSIFLIGTIVFFTSSCDEKDDDIKDKIDLLDGNDYFPLQKGNYWELSYMPQREIDKIEELDGKEYFRSVTKLDTLYYRKTEEGKIFQRAKNSSELLRFDLLADVGESWTFQGLYLDVTWHATLQSKTDTVELDNYTLYNCYRFFFDIPGMADDEYLVWLAPGLGIVEEAYFGGTSDRKKLEEARINGIRIEF